MEVAFHMPELIMRPGVDPYTAPNKPLLPPADFTRLVEYGLTVERNHAVVLRDGVRILLDLYRPSGAAGEADLPVLLAWSPYGKHARSNQLFWPASGVDPAWLSPLTPFEGPDPVAWCPRGYAIAVADPRGAWLSEGEFHHNGRIEGEDCCEVIAWLAAQSWSNGKVGMSGVSYLAAIQYLAASLRPPALAAINPWEGFSDWYREFAYHGGIPETGFTPRASDAIRFSRTRTEDTWANVRAHPLYDDYWRSKEIELESIETPAFVVASWSDQGLHTRGTLAAYQRMRSPQKWLEVHGQKKWAHYYRPESQARRVEFFDHFLKRKRTALSAWPKVRIEVREQAGNATQREEQAWPLARARGVRLWLDADGRMSETPAQTGCVHYGAVQGRAHFDHRFAADTEITGHAKLKLWVEAAGADDMDLFVALQKCDAQGEPVGFNFYAFYDNGPVALGWLRVSHRALDAARSTAQQPVHSHLSEQRLRDGEIVAVEIEIWPSSTLFRAGETLRLIVQGSDIYKESLPQLPFCRHEETRNHGAHVIHVGGPYDSHLLIPVV
jgi:predicted acyl esterase